MPGIPRRTADVVLDPTVTRFDVAHPLRPFMIGRCLLQELRDKERYAVMVVKLKEALEVVEEHREAIQAQVDEEHRRFITSMAENTLDDEDLMDAMVDTLGQSDRAMNQLGRSDEAMRKLGQSDEAMRKLTQSAEARAKLVQSDEMLQEVEKSAEARAKLVQSDAIIQQVAHSAEAMGKLVQSEDALAEMRRAAKKDPALRAKLLALFSDSEPEASP